METEPKYKSNQFKCPHCHVISQQKWFNLFTASKTVIAIIQHIYFNYRTDIPDYSQKNISAFLESMKNELSDSIKKFIPEKFAIATCISCDEISLWVSQKMVYPKKTSLPPPNVDMDKDIQELYNESANILIDSPKGAAALLRLALQKMLKQVGKSGDNINKDIKDLVSEGLSPKIQKALDLVRVVGNNAVHPGEINLDDKKEIALKLFQILNYIADEMITKPKELQSLYSDIIPEDSKNNIKKRDENIKAT